MAIRVGCGSWADDKYVGLLHRKGLPRSDRLRAYAHWFERVEVNVFYHAMQSRALVHQWTGQTPAGFLFDVKLPRAFSENPRLAAASESAATFGDAIQPLVDAKKLGAFLLTLAPAFGPGRNRLDELDLVAEKLLPLAPLAVELRHRGWVDGAHLATTLDYFRRRNLTWVALDLPRIEAPAVLPPIDEVTTPRLAYLRLHGRNPDYLKSSPDPKARHRHDYTASELSEIAARIHSLAARAKDVHVSVNNHYADFAPKAALALRRLLGQPVPSALPPDDSDGQRSLFD